MTVPFRILSLLLCLLVAGPVSAPAWALAGPETRVGGSPDFSSASTSADLAQTLEPRRESGGYGYDFASGMHKYLYAHANPINGIDPTGHFNMPSLLSGTAIMTYLGTTAFSYSVGKAIEAGISLGIAGDMRHFEWYSHWDLLNLVPGGAFAKLAQLRPLVAASKLVTKVNGKWKGVLHNAVGNAPMKPAAMLKETFESTFPGGISVNGITLSGGNPKYGFRHILERHFIGYWNGEVGQQAGHAAQTFWPLDTSVHKLADYAKEAMAKVTPAAGKQAHPVELSNGIKATLVVENGQIVTFYPVSGPGVIDWLELEKWILK